MAFKKIKENFPIYTMGQPKADEPLTLKDFEGRFIGETTKGKSKVWLFTNEHGNKIGIWNCTSIGEALGTVKPGSLVRLDYLETVTIHEDDEGVVRTYKAVDVAVDDGT